MDGTFGAGRFGFLIWTFVKALPGIIQELTAVITRRVSGIMLVVTVHYYHCLDGFLFPNHSCSVSRHIGNPLWKSRLTCFSGQPALLRFYSSCSNLAENCLQVFIRRADGHDIEIIYQHLQYIWCDEGRQAWSQSDIFNAQMQQRQQDGHRFLLVP